MICKENPFPLNTDKYRTACFRHKTAKGKIFLLGKEDTTTVLQRTL